MNQINSKLIRRVAPYVVAVGTTAIALFVSLLLEPILTRPIGAFFFLAITISTSYGGIKPGIVSIVLSGLAIKYFLIPPIHQLSFVDPNDVILLSIFLLVATIITLLNNELKNSKRQVEQLSQRLLAENADRLRLALTAAKMGMWDWDMQTGKITWSPEHAQLFGMDITEFDGKYETFDACLHPEDRDNLNLAIERAIRERSDYCHQYRIIWPDGSIHWVEGRGRVTDDRTGQPVRMSGTIMDIGDRKQDEEFFRLNYRRSQILADISLKIRQSLQLEEILQTAVTEVQQLIYADRVVVFRLWEDGSGKVVQEAVVPGFPVILGQNIDDPCFTKDYQEQYRLGRIVAIEDIYQGNVETCYLELLQQFAVKANLVVPLVVREKLWGLLIAHQCSRPRQWTNFEIELLQQVANQMSIALGQAQLLEAEIRQREELARSNADLQQFAYIASHDLQEPLRMVTSYLQIIQRRYAGKLDNDADEFIHYAVDGAARMQTLIQDLLKYSRISTQGDAFAGVNCTVVLQDILENLQVAIEESGAIVTSDELPEVMGDTTQLGQLFQNLIGNAIKFRRDGVSPKIHISAVRHQKNMRQLQQDTVKYSAHPLVDVYSDRSRAYSSTFTNLLHTFAESETEWLFSVQDNGIGIDPKYVDRIFLVFQRLHSRQQYPGTGIGLAVCKKIVERHGGEIWVESEPGQGATFYFTIADKMLKST